MWLQRLVDWNYTLCSRTRGVGSVGAWTVGTQAGKEAVGWGKRWVGATSPRADLGTGGAVSCRLWEPRVFSQCGGCSRARLGPNQGQWGSCSRLRLLVPWTSACWALLAPLPWGAPVSSRKRFWLNAPRDSSAGSEETVLRMRAGSPPEPRIVFSQVYWRIFPGPRNK